MWKNDVAHPIRMTAIRIVANDIRNVTLFGSGRGVLDGHAEFLAEPYPGFHAFFRLDAVPLDALSLPVLAHTAFVLKGGVLAAGGALETSPSVRNARLSELTLSGVKLDYVQAKNSPSAPVGAAHSPANPKEKVKE